MADFDLFNQEQNDVTNVQEQLPVVIDVLQEEQQDKRKRVQHSVVFPAQEPIPPETDDVFRLPPPQVFARSFPFPLDPFQLKAVSALERGENVLVSAHTSAGKTVVAEYAVALCLKRRQRVVYTSPIKALSNQKFRDWQEAAERLAATGTPPNAEKAQNVQVSQGDMTGGPSDSKDNFVSPGETPTVGLLTGDTSINRDAQILVMTTEVLRNMLQSSSELLRELGAVVFDEVHYMRNAERGTVWEDCISLLDPRVSLTLLSATLPNSAEFASWVTQTRNRITHVIYTEFRPVPLGFYVAPLLARSQFQLFTSDNKELNVENFNKAIQSLPTNAGFGAGQTESRHQPRGNKAQVGETVMNVLETLGTKGLSPIIVFSFGKLRCEELAWQCRKNERLRPLFSSPVYRQAAMEIFDAALQQLPPEDREIEQIQKQRELLQFGVAVHHSGLLPFVKEVVELLFQEDLVKVIFVTETFAMGLNLPARAVVFSEFQKFDGEIRRNISPAEFIQMAGRAGRRGKDVQGIVVTVFTDPDDLQQITDTISADSEPLNSAYRLNFGAILNFLSYQGLKPEDAVDKSFRQFQRSFQLPKAAAVNQTLHLQIKSAIAQFNNSESKLKLFDQDAEVGDAALEDKQKDDKTQQQSLIAVEQLGNYLLLKSLHGVRTGASFSEQEIQEKTVTRGRIVKFEVFETKTDLLPRVAYGVVIGSARLGGGLYVDVLVPAAAQPALSGAPSAQFAKPPPQSTTKKVQKLRTVFGGQLVDSILPSFSLKEGTGEIIEYNIENDSFPTSETTKSVDLIHFKNINDQQLDDFVYQNNRTALEQMLDDNNNNDAKINNPDDDNTIITDMHSFESHQLNDIIDDEFKIVSPTILNGFIVELGAICSSSSYLNLSKSAKQLISEWETLGVTVGLQSPNADNQDQNDIQKPFGGANAKIIRLSINHITGISKSFLQQVPISLDSADSRSTALQQLSTAIKRLAVAYLEEIVKKYPDLRGTGLIYKLLEHADDALRMRDVYPNHTDGIQLIRNNKLNYFLTTDPILHYGLLSRTFSDNQKNKPLNNGQAAWNSQIPQERVKFQQLFKELVKSELFRRYLSGRLNAPSKVLAKELRAMEAVLTDLNYIDQNRVITQKGLFAAKLNAVHELILSECLFNASLQGINAIDLVTLVGLLLPEKTMQQQMSYSTEVEQLAQVVKESAERVWITCERRGSGNGTAPGAEPVQPVNGAIARQWASGDSIIQLCKQFKGLFEGTAVRLLKRLVTALQQLGQAAESWAQENLQKVVEEAIRRVNRGIVKADSLYIVQETDDI